MTQIELFELIQEKKQKIEELLQPDIFTLNPEVNRLEKEIEELQGLCQHQYTNIDGRLVCSCCGKEGNIVLYKGATCPQCKIVKMKLDKANLAYEEITDEQEMMNRGIKSIPTLEIDGERLYGPLNISRKIKELEDANG